MPIPDTALSALHNLRRALFQTATALSTDMDSDEFVAAVETVTRQFRGDLYALNLPESRRFQTLMIHMTRTAQATLTDKLAVQAEGVVR